MDKLNVLLVDDRPENLIALEALISRDDINIFTTTSPNDALKISWEKDIALALVDVQMPEMDGFELVSYLKASPKTRNILVIFVTAISKENRYAVKGLEEGAIDYLYKPLDPEITVAKVNAFLELCRNRREIEQQNKTLENYSVIVNNAADIMCSVYPESLEIRGINAAVRTLFGVEPEYCSGKAIYQFTKTGTESNTYKLLGNLKEENKVPLVYEECFVATNDGVIWLECRAVFKNGIILLTMSDITARREYEKNLIEAKEQALRAKQSKEIFLANMSHEIRTPLNGIIGLTNMLMETGLGIKQQELVKLLSSNSQTLLGIVNDILDISKIEAGKFTIHRAETNLRDLIESLIGMMRFKGEEKGIELISAIDKEVPDLLMVDGLRLNQILINLIGNAIKFTENGHVKLSVSALQSEENRVQLQFAVSDTGIGIAADKINSIFENYAQAEDNTTQKFGGTGLGLGIVKNLINLKGGKLNVESKLGQGSTFTFTNWYNIVKTKARLSHQNDKLTEFTPFNQPKILLAEDNKLNQLVLREMMKKWNVLLDIANNGKEAVTMLQENEYALILMDSQMPEMNGYDAAKNIRSGNIQGKKDIPIISISAGITENEQNLAREAGMNEVIGKPVNASELYSKIKQLLQ